MFRDCRMMEIIYLASTIHQQQQFISDILWRLWERQSLFQDNTGGNTSLLISGVTPLTLHIWCRQSPVSHNLIQAFFKPFFCAHFFCHHFLLPMRLVHLRIYFQSFKSLYIYSPFSTKIMDFRKQFLCSR